MSVVLALVRGLLTILISLSLRLPRYMDGAIVLTQVAWSCPSDSCDIHRSEAAYLPTPFASGDARWLSRPQSPASITTHERAHKVPLEHFVAVFGLGTLSTCKPSIPPPSFDDARSNTPTMDGVIEALHIYDEHR